MPSIHDFETWKPLLRAVRAHVPSERTWRGRIGLSEFSLPVVNALWHSPSGVDARAEILRLLAPVQQGLGEARLAQVDVVVEVETGGHVKLSLLMPTAHRVHQPRGTNLSGHVVLVDGAVPAPARAQARQFTGTGPARSADPRRLERVLRKRLPDATGATEEEIAAAEARLGLNFPEELKAVYRITRGRGKNHTSATADRHIKAIGCELFPLDQIGRASDPAMGIRSGIPFDTLAGLAAVTRPQDAVQGLVASHGWLVIGDYSGGSGDYVAVDLTPGPAGHVGQLITISHEAVIGATLRAESFTDLVRGRGLEPRVANQCQLPPAVVMVNSNEGLSITDVASSELEVLKIGWWDRDPSDLTPLVGLPNLRTVTAVPAKIADPLILGKLTGLEFLEVGLTEWQAILAADAVPPNLQAAGISGYDNDPEAVEQVFTRLLHRHPGVGLDSPVAVLEGDLA